MEVANHFLPADKYQILRYNTENLAEIVNVTEGDPKELVSGFVRDLKSLHECLVKTVLEMKGEGAAGKKSPPPRLSESELAQARAWIAESSDNLSYLSDILSMPFVFMDHAFSRPKDSPGWLHTLLDVVAFMSMVMHYTKRGAEMHTDFHDVPTRMRNFTNMTSVANSRLYGSVFRMWGRVLQAHETYACENFMILESRQAFWPGAREMGHALASSASGNALWFEEMLESYDRVIKNAIRNMEQAAEQCAQIHALAETGEYFNHHRVLIPNMWYFVRYFEPRS